MVPFTVHLPAGGKLPTRGLIDSGADGSCFPMAWARILGIDINQDCRKTSGGSAGGKAVQYVYPPGLRAEILGRQITLDVTFRHTPLILLGREDVFQRFKVRFDQRKRRFELEAY